MLKTRTTSHQVETLTTDSIYYTETKMFVDVVLSVFALSLTVDCTNAVAEPGAWSDWSACSGDCTNGIQTRTRQCDGNSCLGNLTETQTCIPVIESQDCARCELNAANIGYLASCDVNKYFQCQKMDDGSYELSPMSCAPCTVWNQAKLTCVLDPSQQDCDGGSGSGELYEGVSVFGTTCIKGSLVFGVTEGDNSKYLMYSNGAAILMSCPRGTQFDITQCACIYVDTIQSTEQQPKPELCISFEQMTETSKWGFSEGRYWVGNHGKKWNSKHVQVTSEFCIEGNKCGVFSSESYLSVDALANALHTWKTFTISLWFKARYNSTMGLFTNGMTSHGCTSLPTVSATVAKGQVTGYVALKNRRGHFNGKVLLNNWNHVVLVKSDDVIELYINGEKAAEREVEGNLLPSHCPILFGVGQNGAFFTGLMDQICLYKGMLTDDDVKLQYNVISLATRDTEVA